MPLNPNAPLRTSADDLVEMVRRRGKIAVDEIRKELKIPLTAVQALVDFLVEEGILGIEYKFTTPYVYLSEGKRKEENQQALSREQFFQKARLSGVSDSHASILWKKYLSENLPAIKERFRMKAKAKGASAEQTEALWQKYLTYL